MPNLLADLSYVVDVQFWIGVGLLATIYGLLTAGLQLNIGFTGIYNFAQAGFMAVGAYAMGVLIVRAHWSLWLALPVSSAIAIAFALVLGISTLRLRGDYFAIATIAAAEVVRYTIQNLHSLTGGTEGLIGFNSEWQKLSNSISSALGLGPAYYLVPLLLVGAALLLIALGLLMLLQRTPWGRVLEAIREDENAARALGKPVFRCKLQSLAIAAFLASIAGYLLVLDLSSLSTESFLPEVTFIALAMLLVGGLGSYWGVLVGVVGLQFVLEATTTLELPLSEAKFAALRFVLIGAILIAFAVWRPQGIFGRRSEGAGGR
ncbi:MAG: branched-chain amino acid ABC transporter permease [Actinobacteria bacterium]|nr:branched-chain amino acid ABC transporter permease [Actinomycetota bacterium]